MLFRLRFAFGVVALAGALSACNTFSPDGRPFSERAAQDLS